MTIVILLAIGVLAFGLRVALIWQHRLRGCDAYYFLLSSEVYKKNHKLPIVLPPIYALEEQEQWYPPGFSIFLSVFPRKLIDKYYWVLNPLLDSLAAMLTAIVAWLVTGNTLVMLVAGLCYVANTASMVDCSSLNSRILGLLLFALTMLSAIAFAIGNYLYIIPAIIFGSIMLLSHKSSSQLFYFLMIVMSLALWSWHFIVVLAGSIILALIVSRGFMKKVWKGQYDILAFWYKNWEKLGAHQIYGSPVYKDLSDKDTRVHLKGWKGVWKSVSYLGLNAFILPLIIVVIHYYDLTLLDKMMLWWVAGTYLLGIITQGIPLFRFAGEGYRYLKLAALPISYLCTLPFHYNWQPMWIYYVLLIGAFILGVYLIWRLFGYMTSSKSTTIPFMDTGIDDIIKYLKENNNVRNILCIPEGIGDAIGYYTRKPVLRGTHNVPFSRVAPFFPVYRLPLEYLVKGYDVSHVVIMVSYVEASMLELDIDNRIIKSGEFEMYGVSNE